MRRVLLMGAIQLTIAVVLMAGVEILLQSAAGHARKVARERSEIVGLAHADARDILMNVSFFAVDGDGAARDAAVSALADLNARLDSLLRRWEERADGIAAVRAGSIVTMAAAEKVWNSADGTDRSNAFASFNETSQGLEALLVELQAGLLTERDREATGFTKLRRLAMGLMVLIPSLSGTVFFWRHRKGELAWRTASDDLEFILRDVHDTDEDRGHVSPLFGPEVAEAVEALRSSYRELIVIERAERLHARFAQEFIEALEIDDSPEHVYKTVERAAHSRMGNADFRLLVTDASGMELQEAVTIGQSLCSPPVAPRCAAIRSGRLVDFTQAGGLARCPFLEGQGLRVLCAPVAAAGKSFAVAQVSLKAEQTGENLGTDLMTLVSTLGTRLGVLRALAERELQAATDPLTGLANRRAMKEVLHELDRNDAPYALVACDLDHFKKLNDVHGHDVGDRCLETFAKVLKEGSRSDDLACRPGGEEFLLILGGLDSSQAERVASRIRDSLARSVEATGPSFTASIGIAAHPEHPGSYEDLLALADKALYQAKKQGRDCAVIAESNDGNSDADKGDAEPPANEDPDVQAALEVVDAQRTNPRAET